MARQPELVVEFSDRCQEMRSRLNRLRSQALQGNRAKCSRLMRKGKAIAERFFRDGHPVVKFVQVGR